ncbi:IS66 family insertion sequence element accessory protein TnpB [Thalassotalea sp. PS06]|nr:IS66 family insertion sequence element accessory protein TnpB [Thalassotalea sp. PS06]
MMKMFVEPEQVFLHRDAVDFRKSIDGLVGIVEQSLGRDAYTGALFVFCNKSKNKLKLLYWDKTGFALW